MSIPPSPARVHSSQQNGGLRALAGRGRFAYFALFGGVVALSFSGIFVHWSAAPGVVTSFYRMVIGSVVLLPVVAWRARRFGLPSRAALVFPILGGVFTALDQGLWSTAIGFTSIANATLLNNIAPLWVALFAVLFWRDRMKPRFWLGLLMTLAGAGVVLGTDMLRHPQLTLGDSIALGSSLAWAGYYLVTQRGRVLIDTLLYLWMITTVTALLLGITCAALGAPLAPYGIETWLAILAAGFISQIGGHFLLAYALGHLPASVVSPTMISQPVMTSLLAIPLAGQALAPGQWLGGLTVLAGIYLVNISREAPRKSLNGG